MAWPLSGRIYTPDSEPSARLEDGRFSPLGVFPRPRVDPCAAEPRRSAGSAFARRRRHVTASLGEAVKCVKSQTAYAAAWRLEPRDRLQRVLEDGQRALDISLVVDDRDVDLAAALQHAAPQTDLVEPPQLGAVGGHDGTVVDDGLVGEHDVEHGWLAHHLR